LFSYPASAARHLLNAVFYSRWVYKGAKLFYHSCADSTMHGWQKSGHLKMEVILWGSENVLNK